LGGGEGVGAPWIGYVIVSAGLSCGGDVGCDAIPAADHGIPDEGLEVGDGGGDVELVACEAGEDGIQVRHLFDGLVV